MVLPCSLSFLFLCSLLNVLSTLLYLAVTALIFGFDDSTLSQGLLINVLLKSCISVLFLILVELVSMWLGSLCKDSPRFYESPGVPLGSFDL